MYKHILFFVASVLYVGLQLVQAQGATPTKGPGSVSGIVVDGQLQAPLPFVSVAVKSDSLQVVTGQITNEAGSFEITGIPVGTYQLELQFVGFKQETREIVISKEAPDVQLGTVALYDDVAVLEEIAVTAERSTIEQKVDRKVIHIGKDLATTGPTASDLMVNLPSVDVDQDGNISMRGNDNVIVLVDGKPTNQSASQLLQQIPSNSIETIELITNPSAKYVPEGMSGIINIVLRKNTNLGFNGTVTGGWTQGSERRNNGSLDLNYRTGKTNLFFNYALTDGPMPTDGTIDRFEDNSHEVWFSLNDRTSHLLKTGLDIDVTPKTTVSLYAILNDFQNRAFRSTDILFAADPTQNFGQQYSAAVDNTTTTFNMDVRHQLANGGWLELEVDRSVFDGEEFAAFDFYGDAFGVTDAAELIGTKRRNTTFNLDYEADLDSKRKLELGLEARIQQTDNSYETSNPNFLGGIYALDRDIYAAYANYRHQAGQWSYQLGARLEAFDQESLFTEAERTGVAFNDLIYSIYPSAFLTYVPNPETQRDAFNVSLSRRVDRPNLSQLNPMRAWSSARITNVGNPGLFPQFTNSVELNYTRQFEAGSLTAGVFYRRIYDEITRFGFDDPANAGNILFSYDNYQDNSAYGYELTGSVQLTNWWSVNASGDLYSQTQKGVAQDEFREVQNVIYNLRMNHSLKATKKLTFQVVGLYRGGNTNLQYRTLSFYFLNAGARYSLFKGQGTLSVNMNDIFRTQRFAFSGERPVLQRGSYQWDSRSLFLGYSHRFGKGKKRAPKRKKRDKNEKKNVGGF